MKRSELELVAQAVGESGVQYLERLETDSCRITLVSSDGDVLYDSKTSADKWKNHAKREEIKEALKKGFGEKLTIFSNAIRGNILLCKKACKRKILFVSQTMLPCLLCSGMLTPISNSSDWCTCFVNIPLLTEFQREL